MFLEKNRILKSINRKQAFVEVNLKENSIHISYVIINNRNGSLSIVAKNAGLTSLSELKTKLPNNISVHFIITGDGVLFRILENPDKLTIPELIETTFSTIDLKTIYYSVKFEGENHFLSLIRKEKLDDFIGEIKRYDLEPTRIYLGQSNITVLGKYVDKSNVSIETGGLVFNFRDRELANVSKGNTQEIKYYIVGDEKIEPDYVIAFSTAILYFGQNENTQSCNDFYSLNQYYIKNHLYKQFFNLGWKTAVGFLFATLLINFFLFDNLNKQNNEILQKIYQSEKGRDVKMQKANQTKEELKILSEFGFLNQYAYTQYVDELSNSLLEGMSFDELTINPIFKSKTDKRIAFSGGKISLQGKNLKKSRIDLYKESIEKKQWVNTTNLKSVSRKGVSSSYTFTMDIEIIH